MKPKSAYVAALLTVLLSIPLALHATIKALPWSGSAPMSGQRYYHTATKLTDGKILIVGGRTANALATITTEIYDPTSNTWTKGPVLGTPRSNHTATLLVDGKVLVAGGQDATGASLNAVHLYDPVANTWEIVGAMATTRTKHTATLLTAGSNINKVLVVGGASVTTATIASGNPTELDTTELYDPATKTWSTPTGAFGQKRFDHAAVVVGSTIIVTGGENDGAVLSTTNIYNMTAGTWTLGTNAMNTPRTRHTATVFGTDKILVAGGYSGTAYLNTAETCPSGCATWTATTNTMPIARAEHSATLFNSGLQSGNVIVAGGYNGGTTSLVNADVYSPTSNSWSATGALVAARKGHAAVLLNSGKALVTGGANGTASLNSTEQFDPNMAVPTATTNAGSSALSTTTGLITLTLNGTVNSKGSPTAVSFDFSTDSAVATGVTTVASTPASIPATTTADTAVKGTKVPVACGIDYYYKVKAVNGVGTIKSSASAPLKRACVKPTVKNGTPTVGATSATLNGTVMGNGAAITALTYELGIVSGSYGITASPGTTVNTPTLPTAATAGVTAMTAVISGSLDCNKKYYYRFNATNGTATGTGTTNGTEGNFTTKACAPTAITEAATSITTTGAKLNGIVSNSGGATTTVTFDFATNSGFITGLVSVPAGSVAATVTTSTPVSAVKTGLLCNTAYHYRIKAVNSAGTTVGNDPETFTTSACVPPTITNGAVSNITSSGAKLNGTVKGNSSPITALKRKYRKASETSYPTTGGGAETDIPTPPTMPIAATVVSSPMSATLTGLACNTTYYYKFVATNSGSATGGTEGAEGNFKTSACTANLGVTLTDGNGVTSATAGSSLTYTAVVSNAGTDGGNNAIFKSPVATNVTVNSVSCAVSAGSAVCPTSLSVTSLQGTGLIIPTLPASGSVTFTLSANVNATATSGVITKIATVTAPTGVTDSATINNSASDIDRITVKAANLEITDAIVLTPASPTAGATFTAQVKVKNTGTVAAGRFYVDVWLNQGSAQTCGATTSDAWKDVPSLAPGASTDLTFTLTAAAAGTVGARTLRAYADSWCEVNESDETTTQQPTLTY